MLRAGETSSPGARQSADGGSDPLPRLLGASEPTEGRYVLTLTMLDGNEVALAHADEPNLLLGIRDSRTAARKTNGERLFCYRVLDTNDYERGAIEWGDNEGSRV